jgi:hypothetical protein
MIVFKYIFIMYYKVLNIKNINQTSVYIKSFYCIYIYIWIFIDQKLYFNIFIILHYNITISGHLNIVIILE